MMKLKETIRSKTFWGKILTLGGAFLTGAVTATDAVQQFVLMLF